MVNAERNPDRSDQDDEVTQSHRQARLQFDRRLKRLALGVRRGVLAVKLGF